MTKISTLTFFLCIALNCLAQQKTDFVFCGQVLIQNSKTQNTFDPCLHKNVIPKVMATFGKPDSVIIFDVPDTSRILFYSKNYFQFFDNDIRPEYLVIKDSTFNLIFNDKIKIKVTDKIDSLAIWFPDSFNRFRKSDTQNYFSIFYAYKKDLEIQMTDTFITFDIERGTITKIRFTTRD